jgi:hypothetical protein
VARARCIRRCGRRGDRAGHDPDERGGRRDRGISDEGRLTRAVWDRWLRPRKHSTGSPVGVTLLCLHRAVQETTRRIDPGLFG